MKVKVRVLDYKIHEKHFALINVKSRLVDIPDGFEAAPAYDSCGIFLNDCFWYRGYYERLPKFLKDICLPLPTIEEWVEIEWPDMFGEE